MLRMGATAGEYNLEEFLNEWVLVQVPGFCSESLPKSPRELAFELLSSNPMKLIDFLLRLRAPSVEQRIWKYVNEE